MATVGTVIIKARINSSHQMVLDGKVKLTPRRKEILWHVAFSDEIEWRLERNWRKAWSHESTYVPYLAGKNISAILTYLRGERLIRWSPSGWRPGYSDRSLKPIPLITPIGISALLERFEHQVIKDA